MEVKKIEHPDTLKVGNYILTNIDGSLKIGKIEKFGQSCDYPSVEILFNENTRDFLIVYLKELINTGKYLLIAEEKK
jgi:hypothetical protein